MPNNTLFRWCSKVYPQNESEKNEENTTYLLQWKFLFWNKLFMALYIFLTVWPSETNTDLFSSPKTSSTPHHWVNSRLSDTVSSTNSALQHMFFKCYFLEKMVLICCHQVKIKNYDIISWIHEFCWLIFPKYVRWMYYF